MKKLAFFAIATALVLGMSQCKKEQNQDQPADSGEKVTITLDVKGGKADNGTRVDVDSELGNVTFQQNDTIHVGSGGKYVGKLGYNGQRFVGDISNPTPGEPLYFYFLGNKALSHVSGTETVYTVDISDQSTELPVISMAASTDENGNIVNYTDGNANYHAVLRNKCALMKFTLTEPTELPVKVNNLVTVAKIDFSGNEVAPADNNGAITLYSKSATEKCAILVPQEAVEGAYALINGTYYRCDVKHSNGNPLIQADGLLTANINNTASAGVTDHFFTAGANGSVVRFSPGNLQATTTDYGQTWTWKFAENQYDFIGRDLGNVLFEKHMNVDGSNDSLASATIDFFKWSTENLGATLNRFGITSELDSLQFTGNFVDWGTNQIGEDPANTWRTMSKEEWEYLLNKRTKAAKLNGFARIKVGSGVLENGNPATYVRGLVLLPDNWFLPEGITSFTPGLAGEIRPFQEFTPEEWALMEQNGAVFLPRAGRIYGGNEPQNAGLLNKPVRMNNYGDYWTSSKGEVWYKIPFLRFTSDSSVSNGNENYWHFREMPSSYGLPVRLVR